MKRFLLIFVVLFVFMALCMVNSRTVGEDAWVLCQPDSYVNVRIRPHKTARITGRLYSGDSVRLDGHSCNGYCHVSGVASEDGDGWVSTGYLVYSSPEEDGHTYRIDASGRVACRRGVDGTRRRWLHTDDILTVYMRSEEWCLTSQGFVQTEFIDFTLPVDFHTELDPDDMTWEAD